MKRFSPIFFIWLFNFIFSALILFMTYKTGSDSEVIAWSISTIFTANLLIYHLHVTKNENSEKSNSDVIDE
jgi:hypothetical protein